MNIRGLITAAAIGVSLVIGVGAVPAFAETSLPPNTSQAEYQMWTAFKAYEPNVELGGMFTAKGGYHDTRQGAGNDYSTEKAVDKQGPEGVGSAIDLTFRNPKDMDKYSRRLMNAKDDSRTDVLREFFGNINGDGTVDGFDYDANQVVSSDESHLWHIHISMHRKYAADPGAWGNLLQILEGK